MDLHEWLRCGGWSGRPDEVAIDVGDDLVAVGGAVVGVAVADAGVVEAEQDEGLEHVVLLEREEVLEAGFELFLGDGSGGEFYLDVGQHRVQHVDLFGEGVDVAGGYEVELRCGGRGASHHPLVDDDVWAVGEPDLPVAEPGVVAIAGLRGKGNVRWLAEVRTTNLRVDD